MDTTNVRPLIGIVPSIVENVISISGSCDCFGGPLLWEVCLPDNNKNNAGRIWAKQTKQPTNKPGQTLGNHFLEVVSKPSNSR